MIPSWERMICLKKYLTKNLEKSVLEPVDFKGFLGHTPTPTLQKTRHKPRVHQKSDYGPANSPRSIY